MGSAQLALSEVEWATRVLVCGDPPQNKVISAGRLEKFAKAGSPSPARESRSLPGAKASCCMPD